MIWLDVLEEFGKNECNIMPVLNEKINIGYYELDDIIKIFSGKSVFKRRRRNFFVKKPKLIIQLVK